MLPFAAYDMMPDLHISSEMQSQVPELDSAKPDARYLRPWPAMAVGVLSLQPLVVANHLGTSSHWWDGKASIPRNSIFGLAQCRPNKLE